MPAYPYLPQGRSFRFVPDGHPFLEEAKQARQSLAGDPIWPNGAILVKDGRVIARAGNGFNRGSHLLHICPRVVFDCPSGQGYELCRLHDHAGHAEQMVVKVAQEAGEETQGADVYMYGHWWCCEPCWNAMIAAGVKDVYLLEGAHEEFTREKVHAPYLEPSIKRVSLLGNTTDIWPSAMEACTEIGCALEGDFHPQSEAILLSFSKEDKTFFSAISFGKPIVLLSREGTDVPADVHGHALVTYHLVYKIGNPLRIYLKNILRQF